MPSLYPEQIETDRLVLEQLCHDTVDVFEFYRRLSDHEANIEEVTEYTAGIDPHRTPKETNDYIDRAENSWNDNEKAWYIIRPREGENGAGEIAGVALLETEWERRVGTLGIVLRKPFWGRGYSAERATALLDVAFERLDLK
jgi:ribosomal-protein-alanine N-acetyltransferase